MDRGVGLRNAVMKKLTLPALSAAALLVACAGKRLDLGSDGGADRAGQSVMGGGGTTGTAPPACTTPPEGIWPDPADCFPTPDSTLVGMWRGHWPDPTRSTNVDAELRITGLTMEGKPCGTFKIGEGPPLPPATNAAASYPPGTVYGAGGAGWLSAPTSYYPGHEYPLVEVESTSNRLAFQIPKNDIFRGWCELQTQFEDTETCFDISAALSADESGCYLNSGAAVSCAQVTLCRGVCRCENRCCYAVPTGGWLAELHWDDGALEGVINQQQIYLDPLPKP